MDRFSNILTALAELVKTRLETDTVFVQPPKVPVYTERLSDLGGWIDKAIGSIGMCLIVATPQIVSTGPQRMVKVSVTVDVLENPMVNQGKSASQVPAADGALNVAGRLWFWQPSDVWTPIHLVGIKLVDAAQEPPLLHYNVEMETNTHLHVTE